MAFQKNKKKNCNGREAKLAKARKIVTKKLQKEASQTEIRLRNSIKKWA